MAYFDEDFATVEYDPDTSAVVSQMVEYAEGEDFHEYMDAIIDALEDTGSDRVLADTSRIPPLAAEDQAWSVQDWAPRAEDAGLEHMALLMPESVVAEMSIDKIIEMADDSVNRDLFEDEATARSWLERQ